ncbi:MAG: hypothetical protein KatS3mg102_2107 [Planctomycetota bacterium]|nr:MAG: hypothetical protein KatS3mg102_2107 [Planctomycetota bacterium]
MPGEASEGGSARAEGGTAAALPARSEMTLRELGAWLDAQIREERILISEAVDALLERAVMLGASDVHIEPTAGGLRVRYRVDGVFQDLGLLPERVHEPMIARVKVLADLMSHRRELSQEGRIHFAAGGQERDFRVSVVPTVAGEKAVLRMFNPAHGLYKLADLGYAPAVLQQLERMLNELQGMVVLTGPAGSGKTTTLYACLRWLYDNKDQYASICTIEDPVEYYFGRFAQIQVNRNVGLDFAKLLAAVLRQDPQVIMIGEIRDVETCEIALRAGLTGHMVLTTIHTGSAPEVVTRILNMGIEPFVAASALTGVVAQRLVRRVCERCAEEHTPERAQVEFIERALERTGFRFRRGRGCRACGYTGFRGRVPVAETLVFNDQLRSLVLEQPSTASVRRLARGAGMVSLLEDALTKVAEGVTTLEEVLRVVSLSGEGVAP